MMSNVYLVLNDYMPYDGGYQKANVFSTKEKAEQYIAKLKAEDKFDEAKIYHFVVDDEKPTDIG